jgi:hypothetical protein
MKVINLLSVIEAYLNLETELFQKLMNSYGVKVNQKNGVRDHELECIQELSINMYDTNKNISIFDNYYLSYSILILVTY